MLCDFGFSTTVSRTFYSTFGSSAYWTNPSQPTSSNSTLLFALDFFYTYSLAFLLSYLIFSLMSSTSAFLVAAKASFPAVFSAATWPFYPFMSLNSWALRLISSFLWSSITYFCCIFFKFSYRFYANSYSLYSLIFLNWCLWSVFWEFVFPALRVEPSRACPCMVKFEFLIPPARAACENGFAPKGYSYLDCLLA